MIFGFERGVNEICAFWGDFTQRRLTVSCRRFGTTVGGVEIRTAVLVKIQVIWDVRPVDWSIYLHLRGQQPKMSRFLFLPPILDSTEAGAFLFCDFTEYCPRGEKKFAPFSYVCFSGGSFQCFWCTWTCYECSNCTTFHRNVRHPSFTSRQGVIFINTCVRTSCLTD